METTFLLIKDQLHAHKWHLTMAKHQELNGNSLAGIFKKLRPTQIQMARPPLNNKIKAVHRVLFLAAFFQLWLQIITATTQQMGARKRSTIFVAKQAICTWRKKGSSFSVLTRANNKNKLTKLNRNKTTLKNCQLSLCRNCQSIISLIHQFNIAD